MALLNKRNKKVFVLLVIFAFLFTSMNLSFPTVKAKESNTSVTEQSRFSDLNNHWAESVILEWVQVGLLQGYLDGTIRPDQVVTRGEVMALVNRAFAFEDKTNVQFSDLQVTDWEYDEVQIAVKAGYVQGYPDHTIRVKQPISRQEAAVIIARLLQLDTEINNESSLSFTDVRQIADWSLGAITAIISNGIMQGYGNGTFAPEANITRAEMIVSLKRSIEFLEAHSSEEEPDLDEETQQPDGPTIPVIGAPIQPELKINKVTAQNGSITVEFNRSIGRTPSGDDFTITQTIDDDHQTSVTAERLKWDETTKTAEITIPEITVEEGEISVVFTVRYLGGATVHSAPIIIKRNVPLVIANQGQAEAVIIVPEDAEPILLYSANKLREYVEKSSGAQLPIITATELLEDETYSGFTEIYIGHYTSDNEAHIEAGLENLDRYGFLIYSNEERITIIGPSVQGTRNGTFDFLERYVGVRWLMPGPNGTDVPQYADIAVIPMDVREEPVFKHRTISAGLSGEWVQANKLQGDIKFMHNLYDLFPPEKFGESNPEFYPGGKVPVPDDRRWGQPCFASLVEPNKLNEDTIKAAVEGIIEYFDANPDQTSYSLGVNDTSNYCESDRNHPSYPGKTNSTGYLDMSDIFYAWVNEVVEQVLEVHPDKWFGLLAYNNVTDPPSFPVHPRVIPFFTKDRMTWIDDEVQAIGHDLMDEWSEIASQVAWYDYMYGVHYMVPRVYPHLMSELFQYAAENNVYGDYIEMYHNAGDGPKAWIAAKLMWDPYLDIDELLQEWYERTVGPAAAADLAAVYNLWEHFWTERIKESTWFELGKHRTYLPFNDQSYVNLVTNEDIEQSMRLLEDVIEKAVTAEQKARAETIRKMFQYYEATVLSYPRELDPIEDEATALALLEEIAATLNDRMEFARTRLSMKEEFESDENLRFRSSRWYEWTGWNSSEFWNMANYIRNIEEDDGPVSDRVDELANQSEASDFADFIYLLQRITNGTMPSLTQNASFEDGIENAQSWTFWNPNRTADIQRVDDVSRTGDASILFEEARTAGVYQIFDVESALTAAEMHYYTPPSSYSYASFFKRTIYR